MVVKFTYYLAVKGEIEIDGIDEEDCTSKLYQMDFEDLIDNSKILDYDIDNRDLESDIVEVNLEIKVSNIKYKPETFLDDDEELEDFSSLPTELYITLNYFDETKFDIETAIEDEIFDETDHEPLSFTYKIIKRS